MKGSIGRVVKWALRRDALPRDVLEAQLVRIRQELAAADEAAAQARNDCARARAESASNAATVRDLEQRVSALQGDAETQARLTDALRSVLGTASDDERASCLVQKAAALTGASESWLVSQDETGVVRVRAALGAEAPEAPVAVRNLASWWFQSQSGHSLRLAPGHVPAEADDSEPDDHAGIDRAVLAVRVDVAPVVGVLLLRDDSFSWRDEVAARELTELVGAGCRACSERERAVRDQLLAELQQARADLDRRDRALSDARAELVARERKSMLGEVTATVSHELRNPLGVIRSSVFYLQRRIGTDDEKVVKHLDRIEQQVGLCNGVIDDLLEFTRGRQTYLVPGNLNTWLASVIEDQESSEPSISFRTELAPDLPPVLFDSDKLRRAMANLLENAVLAVKARAAQAASTDWRPEVVARTARCDDGVSVELTDNGVGMDDATSSRAFEPLFTTRARGTGLGLAIVRKIIDDHGGRISLESSPGLGTKVAITLSEPPLQAGSTAEGPT